MLARRFYSCSVAVKLRLFKSFCCFYDAALWNNFTAGSLDKLRSAYKGKGKGKCIAVCINTYTATGNHLPYGITPGRGDFPAFTPAEAGTRFSDPEGMQG